MPIETFFVSYVENSYLTDSSMPLNRKLPSFSRSITVKNFIRHKPRFQTLDKSVFIQSQSTTFTAPHTHTLLG